MPEEQKQQFVTILKFISSSLVGIINQIQLDLQNDLQPVSAEDAELTKKELKAQIQAMVDMGFDDNIIAQCFNFTNINEIIATVREGK